MIKDVFKSITRGFGYSLGKLLFFGLLGLIAFIIGSKAYALETYTITAFQQNERTFNNTLGYDYSNYDPTTTYHFIKEKINDNSINFNYIVTLDNTCFSSIYIQENTYFSNYLNSDISMFSFFNYYGGYRWDNYDRLIFGFEYNMKITYNFCENIGEIAEPLNIGDNPVYYKVISRRNTNGITDILPYFDLNILDLSTEDYYFNPTFSNINMVGSNIWYYGPNSMYLARIGSIPFTNSFENATGGGGGEDNPPGGETGKDYTNILEEISGKIGTGFQNIKETIENGFNDLKEFFLDVSGLNGLLETFNQLRSNMTNLYNNLNSYFDNMKGFVTGIITGINNSTCEPLEIDINAFGLEETLSISCIGSKVRNINETLTEVFDAICYIVFALCVLLYCYNLFIKFSLYKMDKIDVEASL